MTSFFSPPIFKSLPNKDMPWNNLCLYISKCVFVFPPRSMMPDTHKCSIYFELLVILSWKTIAFFFFLSKSYVCILSCFSHVQFFAAIWTVTCQAPPSMGFSRQEYWSELPCLPAGQSSRPRDQTPVSYISCNGWPISNFCTLGK